MEEEETEPANKSEDVSVKEVATTPAAAIAVVESEVTIYATAIIEDSVYATLVNDDVESLVRFLTSKEHLLRNIAHIEYNPLSSREFRNSKFKHTVQVMLHVKTEHLWEGPRGYIWRHLGSDNSWTRGNGTTITLVKIHQK